MKMRLLAFWKAHYLEILGWLGVVFIQGATLPPMIDRLSGRAADLPPFNMIFFVWVGLLFYLARAMLQRDRVYIASNSIGVFLNSILLYLIASQ